MDNPKRIAIFIDNSNVFHYIHDIKQSDPSWVCLYNPLILAEKLAGRFRWHIVRHDELKGR